MQFNFKMIETSGGAECVHLNMNVFTLYSRPCAYNRNTLQNNAYILLVSFKKNACARDL